MADIIYTIGIVLLIIFFSGLRVINQYQRAVKLRLGKYVKTLQPGLNWIIPIFEKIIKVDVRVITIDVPSQEVITRDNGSQRIVFNSHSYNGFPSSFNEFLEEKGLEESNLKLTKKGDSEERYLEAFGDWSIPRGKVEGFVIDLNQGDKQDE